MICITCNADIPPAWVAAINSNSCPGCSGPIMDDGSKLLMDELKEAMEKMPNDSMGLSGWLLSTYTLIKKGDVVPTNFHTAKISQEQAPSVDTSKLKWANGNGAMNQFAKNAGLDRINKGGEWNEIIKAVNSVNDGLYGGDSEPAQESDYVEAEEPELSFEQKQQILAIAAKKKGSKLTSREAKAILDGNSNQELLLRDNDSFVEAGSGDPNLPIEEEALKSVLENSFTADQSPILQKERMKRLRSQYTMQNGSGGVRRSE